jgi:hypothetical protein
LSTLPDDDHLGKRVFDWNKEISCPLQRLVSPMFHQKHELIRFIRTK